MNRNLMDVNKFDEGTPMYLCGCVFVLFVDIESQKKSNKIKNNQQSS